MKKRRMISIALVICLIATFGLGCRNNGPVDEPVQTDGNVSAPPETPSGSTGEVSQGVTDDEILIGTIALTSGAYAFIGTPAIAGIQACFDRLNAQGGVRGRQVELISYDDQGDPATGKTYIEKMVEEDEVFLLTNLGAEVEPCLPYLQEIGIPCVNVASTDDAVYSPNAPESRIFQIMPAFTTDGRYLAARVLHESLFGPNGDEKLPADAKIAVAYGTDQYSMTTLQGLLDQAELEGATDRFVTEVIAADTVQAAIQKFKNENCQAVILIPYASEWFVAAMDDAQWEVPFYGSFGVSTIASYAPDTYKTTRPTYANIWSDFNSEKGKAILTDMMDALSYNTSIDEATRQSYQNNTYCVAGYCYGNMIATALARFNDHPEMDITWENFVRLVESEPFTWGDIEWSYANGNRMGIEPMAVFEYVGHPDTDPMTEEFMIIRTFETIEDIMKK